ncbi:hypothetical protein [Pleomorphovibrio marinus]|uniref:hypothetical protein n=1 Tax=Pleomorphovibrio marinus TaxID=2164132 RepID=UPI000E0B63E9|nr:hypothetical protein [Pleomorphovibrio marinus]
MSEGTKIQWSDQKLIDEGYKEGKKSFDFLIKEIHDNFNWENVHTAMHATNWVWVIGYDEFGKENKGIPDIPTIKNNAYALLKRAYDRETQVSTGGFSAGWDNGELYLTFTLEQFSV